MFDSPLLPDHRGGVNPPAVDRANAASTGNSRAAVPLSVARELAIVGVAAAAYGAVRAVTEGSAGRAIENAETIEHLERTLGIGWEQSAQSLVIGSDLLVRLVNWIYIWGHWPVIVAAATFLYVSRPTHYRVLRNAIITSGLIGFVFFYRMPTAPPRLLEIGLVDTVLEQSHAYRALQPPSLTNQYAAMPSLHFGWNLLVGIVIFAAFTSLAVRVFAIAMPLAMGFAVVATANHFVLDIAISVVVVAVGLVVAVALERHQDATRGREPASNNPNNRMPRARLH